MIAKKIIGTLLIASPLLWLFYLYAKNFGLLELLKNIGFSALVAGLIVIGAFLLAGCTTTRTIEVPVPVPCTKPNNIPVPHDYMADLNKNAGAQQFVPACLATTESYRNAYNACMMYHGE